ncbi:MAG TPA: hypothetical protein V6D28_11120, partial [Leptolyngbyaceae cyanobacterium]
GAGEPGSRGENFLFYTSDFSVQTSDFILPQSLALIMIIKLNLIKIYFSQSFLCLTDRSPQIGVGDIDI